MITKVTSTLYETEDGSLFDYKDDAELYEEMKESASEIQGLLRVPEDSVHADQWKKYRRGKDYIQHSAITITDVQKKLFDIFQNRIGLHAFKDYTFKEAKEYYTFKDYTFKEAKEYSWQKVLQEMDNNLKEYGPKPFKPLLPLIEQMLRIDDQNREWYKQEYVNRHFTGIKHPK